MWDFLFRQKDEHTLIKKKYAETSKSEKREQIQNHLTWHFPAHFLLSVELSVFDLFVFQPPTFPLPSTEGRFRAQREFSRQYYGSHKKFCAAAFIFVLLANFGSVEIGGGGSERNEKVK